MSANLVQDEILIFKTTLADSYAVERLTPFINTIPGIVSWNVDLHDCDNILRVVCRRNVSAVIIDLLQQNGHQGEELL